ncbi:MAG: TetR/AcrR family transcriptional regulator [Hyphomicrobiales bacterium]|nr:TetR/AcrR family transcriptional regulator [Hyphomicrobiales bacterium]
MSALARRGIAGVTVLDLSERLGVSRSSFYWYFKNRDRLLDELLRRWEGLNTHSIVRQSQAPAASINEAVCNVFRCWVDPDLFSPRLDFAVREWARRSETARRALDRSDGERTAAIRAMFMRYGYPFEDALVRARVLYYMQIGYYALDIKEPMEARLKLTPHYLQTFTGVAPRDEDLASFRAYAMLHAGAQDPPMVETGR